MGQRDFASPPPTTLSTKHFPFPHHLRHTFHDVSKKNFISGGVGGQFTPFFRKNRIFYGFCYLSIIKKIRLFCAAPPEFITGPILTILGFKWPLKNGPVPFQEKIEVFKMLHCKKCSSFSDDVILRARQIEIFSGSLKSFENQPLLCRYLLICLYRLLILQHSVEDGQYQAFLLF